MRVASRHIYAASPDAVLAAMTTPDVLSEKYQALGHREIRIVEHAEHSGGLRVRSKRGVPMEVHGFARRFLSPVNTVEQTDEWGPPSASGARTGTNDQYLARHTAEAARPAPKPSRRRSQSA